MTLHVAISLLCNKDLNEQYTDYAEQLLNHFVVAFKVIYGVHNVTHNVHGLLYLAKDCKLFGALDNFSAFQNENYMQQLLKLLRKDDRPLQQVVRRLTEFQMYKVKPISSNNSQCIKYLMAHEDGPLPSDCTSSQYKKLKINNNQNIIVKTKKKIYCLLKNEKVVAVHNIAKKKNSCMCIIGYQFLVKLDLYTKPCNSSLYDRGIFEVSDLSEVLKVWPVACFKAKMVLFSICDDKFAAFTLLHSNVFETQTLL